MQSIGIGLKEAGSRCTEDKALQILYPYSYAYSSLWLYCTVKALDL